MYGLNLDAKINFNFYEFHKIQNLFINKNNDLLTIMIFFERI